MPDHPPSKPLYGWGVGWTTHPANLFMGGGWAGPPTQETSPACTDPPSPDPRFLLLFPRFCSPVAGFVSGFLCFCVRFWCMFLMLGCVVLLFTRCCGVLCVQGRTKGRGSQNLGTRNLVPTAEGHPVGVSGRSWAHFDGNWCGLDAGTTKDCARVDPGGRRPRMHARTHARTHHTRHKKMLTCRV